MQDIITLLQGRVGELKIDIGESQDKINLVISSVEEDLGKKLILPEGCLSVTVDGVVYRYPWRGLSRRSSRRAAWRRCHGKWPLSRSGVCPRRWPSSTAGSTAPTASTTSPWSTSCSSASGGDGIFLFLYVWFESDMFGKSIQVLAGGGDGKSVHAGIIL